MDLHKFKEESVDVFAAQSECTGVLSFPHIFWRHFATRNYKPTKHLKVLFPNTTEWSGLELFFGMITNSRINQFLM